MARSSAGELEVPTAVVADEAATAVAQLTMFVESHPGSTASLELTATKGRDATKVAVPEIALRYLFRVLYELADGNAVAVAAVQAELTTQQAADLLNLSRPVLIGLLEDDRMPFRRVGNRRKVLLTDVLAHKRREVERRERVLDELTREAEALGLGY